jgi:hypothetical protein
MQPTRVTSSEFQQAFGALSDKARSESVVITKHGRDSLVIMSSFRRASLRLSGIGFRHLSKPAWPSGIAAINKSEFTIDATALENGLTWVT